MKWDKGQEMMTKIINIDLIINYRLTSTEALFLFTVFASDFPLFYIYEPYIKLGNPPTNPIFIQLSIPRGCTVRGGFSEIPFYTPTP